MYEASSYLCDLFGVLASAFANLVVYSSVDEANARKILNAFVEDTGIEVDFSSFLRDLPWQGLKPNPAIRRPMCGLAHHWKTILSQKNVD